MALATVMLWVLVVGGIGSAVTTVAVTGQRNAVQDGAATGSASVSNAGVAEGISFIRDNGLLSLTCAEPNDGSGTAWRTAAGCTVAGWADPNNPVVVAGGTVLTPGSACTAGQDCYRVWIGTVQPYSPPKGPSGASTSTPAQAAILRIHSTGISGVGPGGHAVAVDVTAVPTRFPFGVFANTFSMPASHSPAQSESIFTTGNVSLKCPLSGVDYANNIPAAVHAAGVLSYSNGSCHPPSSATSACNPGYYDQDSNGISFATNSPCYNYDLKDSAFAGTGVTAYATSSFFNSAGLAAYGYRPGGLSASQFAQLKAESQAQGTYNCVGTCLTTALTNLMAAGVTSPVVYDDNGTSPAVADFPSQFFRSPTATCPNPDYQLVLVVRGAVTVHWAGNYGNLVGSVFVPDTGGTWSSTGQAGIIGTLFADNVQFNGNGFIQLDQCFVNSPPGGVLDVTVFHVRTVDTTNVQ